MSPMQRHLSTAVTLLVLCAVLVFMAVYGVKAATAPLPSGGGSSKQSCPPAEKQVQRFVTRHEVEVSVFNGGSRNGLASRTLARLEAAGFRAGEAGNAPASAHVRRAEVWTTRKAESSARLVARALGPHVRVLVTRTDLGPGIDVVVGDGFDHLDPHAPRRMKLAKPTSTCVDIG